MCTFPALPRFVTPFFVTATASTTASTLALHDALPISWTLPGDRSARTRARGPAGARLVDARLARARARSEEHTSELQSRFDLVCRLLLEKKNISSGSERARPVTFPQWVQRDSRRLYHP